MRELAAFDNKSEITTIGIRLVCVRFFFWFQYGHRKLHVFAFAVSKRLILSENLMDFVSRLRFFFCIHLSVVVIIHVLFLSVVVDKGEFGCARRECNFVVVDLSVVVFGLAILFDWL